MQMFRYLRRFLVLVGVSSVRDAPRMANAAIAVLFAICSIVPESALAQPALGIATPTNEQKGCLDDNSLRVAQTPYVWYIVFDRDGGSINLRSEPTVNSPVRHTAVSETPVSIREQVAKEDGYCWLRVQVVKSESITGWVRGDLLREVGD